VTAPPAPPTLVQRLARRLLAAFGWRVQIAWPPPRCVIVVYPHTSNWDFVVGYLARLAAALPVQWIGKDTLFRGPLGPLFRGMGGIPVNRSAPAGMVEQLARELSGRDTFRLAIAPEGTRARTDRWKSGFYRLALAARVPVGLAFIDFGAREVGVTTYLDLSGDEEADLARIREAYRGRRGKRPENAGEIRFRDGP
jgi:1-acyl-sn-glycerol-3-phosphate acyltransferase